MSCYERKKIPALLRKRKNKKSRQKRWPPKIELFLYLPYLEDSPLEESQLRREDLYIFSY
jgi:hypothetical protein